MFTFFQRDSSVCQIEGGVVYVFDYLSGSVIEFIDNDDEQFAAMCGEATMTTSTINPPLIGLITG